jgi:hypothetical protein
MASATASFFTTRDFINFVKAVQAPGLFPKIGTSGSFIHAYPKQLASSFDLYDVYGDWLLCENRFVISADHPLSRNCLVFDGKKNITNQRIVEIDFRNQTYTRRIAGTTSEDKTLQFEYEVIKAEDSLRIEVPEDAYRPAMKHYGWLYRFIGIRPNLCPSFQIPVLNERDDYYYDIRR